MSVQNVTLERGENRSVNFLSAAAAAADRILFRVNQNSVAILVKASEEFGGSDEEILIDAGVKYQALISEDELNQLPDNSTYELSKINADNTATLLFNGTFVVSGEIPDEILAMQAINWQNGSNLIGVEGVYTAAYVDDVLSLGGLAALTLPDPPEQVNGKIFTIINQLGEPATITNLGGGGNFVLAAYEAITVVAVAGKWIKIGEAKINANKALTEVSRTIDMGEDTIIVSAASGDITLTLPANRAGFYGKKIHVHRTASGEENTVTIYDAKTSQAVVEPVVETNYILYLAPETIDSEPWKCIGSFLL